MKSFLFSISKPWVLKKVCHFMKLPGVIEICLILVIFENRIKVDSAHKERKKALPDPCPDVYIPPDTPLNTLYKLEFIEGSDERGELFHRQCCTCNPGFFFDQICLPNNKTSTTCLPCPPGTYITDYAHIKRECTKEVRNCPHEKVWIPSQPDKAPRCDCPKGHHLSDDNETCEPHTICGPGYGVKVNPSHIRDTECEKCAHGYGSQSESYKDTCQHILRPTEQQTSRPMSILATNVSKIDRNHNYSTLSTNSNSTNTSLSVKQIMEQPEVSTSGLFVGTEVLLIILASIAALTVIAIAAMLLWCIFHRSKLHERNNTKGDEEIPLNQSNERLPQSRVDGVFNELSESPQSSRNNEMKTANSEKNKNDVTVAVATLSGSASSKVLVCQNIMTSATALYNESSSSTKERLKKLRDDLKIEFLLKYLIPFYRHFATHFTYQSTDQLVEELNHATADTQEKVNIVFCHLSKLSEDKFNPQLIYEYFEERQLRDYSQLAKKYLVSH